MTTTPRNEGTPSDHAAPPAPGKAGGTSATGGRRRRLGAVVLVAVGFVAGSLTSGAGAVWAAHQFVDVPTSSAFHADIDWLVDHGIANGYGDGTYRPTAPVSRQAAAAFLHRYNGAVHVAQGHQQLSNTSNRFIAQASCESGERPLAGGGTIDGSNLVITDTYPYGPTWYVIWETKTGGTTSPNSWTVWVLCAPL